MSVRSACEQATALHLRLGRALGSPGASLLRPRAPLSDVSAGDSPLAYNRRRLIYSDHMHRRRLEIEATPLPHGEGAGTAAPLLVVPHVGRAGEREPAEGGMALVV